MMNIEMNRWTCILATTFILVGFSCAEQEAGFDAFGHFESDPILVSSELAGKLVEFRVKEGMRMDSGMYAALVDTTLLHLQKLQLRSRKGAIRSKTASAGPEIAVLEKKKENLQNEEKRFEVLVSSGAATQKQLDDLQAQIELIDRQIRSAQQQEQIANAGILGELDPIDAQMNLLKEQIRRSRIINPISGTVLETYAAKDELTGPGAPLYKIADLSELVLRAYISEPQLSGVRLHQEVRVKIDTPGKTEKEYPGRITWVAEEAEFTPKTVQTKEERANLVYAIKVRVENPDGVLKIGMPAEVLFE